MAAAVADMIRTGTLGTTYTATTGGTGIPLPGCNYFADGYKIVDTEDPAFYSSWNLTFNTWVYTDVYGNPGQLFIGWGWVSPTTGILYDEFGYAVNSKEKQGRDSQTAKAAGAKDISRKAGVAFAEKWGLEEQAGIAMADDLRKWAEWSKTRKRDEAALNSFTTEFTGSSNNEIKGMIDSYLKGDSSPVMTGIDNVAAHRHIANPDTVAAIIKDWYKEYIPQQ